MPSNPAGFINATHQADVRSISSTVRTASRTNAPGPSIQSTTNPAVEKSVNAGRKRAESTRTRDTALALQTAPTLPTARSNIDIEQVGVPFKCQKDQINSTPEGNFVKFNNGKVSLH